MLNWFGLKQMPHFVLQEAGLATLGCKGSADTSSLGEKLEKQTYSLVSTHLKTLSKKTGPLLKER